MVNTTGADSVALADLQAIEAELNVRRLEAQINPTLDRVARLVDLLGQPQRAYPVVHITGTNGKTSTTRMIDALLSAAGLRTGRFTSPHLQSVTERISIDNHPIAVDRYVEAYRDIAPYIAMVDEADPASALGKFEILTAMAFAAFADVPVDVGVIEVGLGGTWDSTNVADGRVAVITPVGLDHQQYLGSTLTDIARNKAGIIKPGAIAIMAEQQPAAATEIQQRCTEVGATLASQGKEFGVLEQKIAVGGQLLRLQGFGGVYDEIFLPLHGAHQAANAAVALAAVEAFFGAGPHIQLDVDMVRNAFATLTSPGRLEPVQSAPLVLLDAAHNPHGAQALAKTLSSEFNFTKLVAVIGVLADKDAQGILTALEPVVHEVVLTANDSPRALPADELAASAIPIFGADRIVVEPRLEVAIETAISILEENADSASSSGHGIVITGSVVIAGEARDYFGKEPA